MKAVSNNTKKKKKKDESYSPIGESENPAGVVTDV